MRNIILIFILVVSSCIGELNISPAYEEKVVINCILTNDSIQTLSINKSAKISDAYFFPEVKDADIALYRDSEIVGKFKRIEYDYWTLKYTPVLGAKYTLKATLNDGTTLTATTVMPTRNLINPVNGVSDKVTRYFRQYSSLYPVWIFVVASDRTNGGSTPLFSDKLREEIGSNHPFADRFNEIGSLAEYSIAGGFTPAYKKYIRISDYENNEEDVLEFCVQARYSNLNFVFFRTASAEYDKYLKTSLEKISTAEHEEDPARWFDETPVYSNIKNGTGIFAAYFDYYLISVNNGY